MQDIVRSFPGGGRKGMNMTPHLGHEHLTLMHRHGITDRPVHDITGQSVLNCPQKSLRAQQLLGRGTPAST